MTKPVKKDLQAGLKKDFSSMTEEEKAEAIKAMGFTAKLVHLKDLELDYGAIAAKSVVTSIGASIGTPNVSSSVVEAAEAELIKELGMSPKEVDDALNDNDIFFRKHLEEVGIAALQQTGTIWEKLDELSKAETTQDEPVALTREDYKAMSDVDIMQPYMDLVPDGVLRKVLEKDNHSVFRDGKARHAGGAYEYIFDHAGVQWKMFVLNPDSAVNVTDMEHIGIDESFYYGDGLAEDPISHKGFIKTLDFNLEYSKEKQFKLHQAWMYQYRSTSFQRGIHDICKEFDFNYFDIQHYDCQDEEVFNEGLIELSPACIEELERVVYEYAKAEFSEKETDETLKAVSLEAVPHLIHKQTVRRIVRLLKGDRML